MAHQQTWEGVAQALLVLGVLWWAWVGYAWLTSVIDPEAGPVRLVFFAAMASMLIAAICVPEAFGDLALVFALTWRRLPVAWLALAGLMLLPSLALGILGMPRYTSVCFPVFVATGILLARAPAPLRVATLVCFAAALVVFAENVFLLRFMP